MGHLDSPKSVTGVTLDKTTLSLKVGANATLTASATPTDAKDKTGKSTITVTE
ncbi:Ig-like domain-containing protein [Latilactobacillus curvatus]|uniref:Ig-like domain-containing protein n=1 Tax=Latilactobacillus curvatus TaxID=28038 RepID=UPI0020A4FDD5|nr:Ig-like domain-containing protein [Latilactobacillus curvatus]